ncbi:hypothetical protein EVAR_5288_1 [Eumeta japonica]|uniref:Lens epithelium-derived growth factor integrase-binding domain-containing protein n=1 Tax=Eumeta variegata TaxID=151549 RepID=A0A4C1TNV7_EUMVA|nr:hypothetical protein EVAR_5288_1 [Eumeta japonica]
MIKKNHKIRKFVPPMKRQSETNTTMNKCEPFDLPSKDDDSLRDKCDLNVKKPIKQSSFLNIVSSSLNLLNSEPQLSQESLTEEKHLMNSDYLVTISNNADNKTCDNINLEEDIHMEFDTTQNIIFSGKPSQESGFYIMETKDPSNHRAYEKEDYLMLFNGSHEIKVQENAPVNFVCSVATGDIGFGWHFRKTRFMPEEDKEALLIAYLPTGRYVGIKVFHSRPATTKNDVSKLQWDRQAALNAIKLKKELEKGEITVQSVIHQLETELNLTDEDKANLDKERSIEERKVRMHFLKTEIEMVELDAKIKTCLSLEKADTDNCLVLLDQLQELPIKSLMLLKHPSVLESVKRMRCYVGNTVSWALNEEDSLVFSKKAQLIRKKADAVYNKFKDLFTVPEGLPFWEFFSERTMQFKKCTAKLEPVELCQLVHEPLEMTTPTSHTMRSAIDAANEVEPPVDDDLDKKKNSTPVKRKTSQSVVSTPNKTSKRKQKKQDEENDALAEEKSSEEANTEEDTKNDANISNKPADNNSESTDKDGSVGDKNEEPKAKRGRESTRKTDPSTPKSPTKRKTKS